MQECYALNNLNHMHYRIPVFLSLILCCQTCSLGSFAQTKGNIFTSDIDHFWQAFDSVQTTRDTIRQVEIMQSLYIDKGTAGLREFMQLRNFDAKRLVTVIDSYPLFWKSIRSSTLTIPPQIPTIETYLDKLKNVYPDTKPANVYFTISAVRAAGVTQDSVILIAAEIAMGDQHTVASEFPDKRLANFFKPKATVDIIPIIIHEYVHAQQKGEGKNLLGQCIYEGACDFITELVLNKPLNQSYLVYGRENEQELKAQFKKEMFSEDLSNWLYNGTTTKTMGDLGYFMGYTICKSYYRNAKNKQQAIQQIIRLNYADAAEVKKFLDDSKFYN
ncbi:secreted protein [Niastella koreensis GR20-10]|uniref:Secreted protein n=3 Tax=Niastella koreensis TaxID=354356 RepID=G8TRD0_NIAKG|nr:secreted protein [Niastella koreensis GR20-10]